MLSQKTDVVGEHVPASQATSLSNTRKHDDDDEEEAFESSKLGSPLDYSLPMEAQFGLQVANADAPTVDEKRRSNELPAESSGSLNQPNNSPGPPSGKEAKYLNGLPLIFMTLSLMIGVLTVALDNNIITTAIPKITSDFNSLNDVAWYGSAYLLAQMSFQPTFGKIYTHFNLKWIYLASGILFETGSVICAAAPNSLAFIVGRAVAGLGAAGLFCGALIIMSQIVEIRKRPLLLGVVSSMYGVASVLGPVLGGVFANAPRLTWRFCFWINLPLGGLVGVIIIFYYPSSSGTAHGDSLPLRQKVVNLGFRSAVILTGTIACLLLALQWGGSVYPWSNSRVWGCLLGFGLLTVLFGFIQARKKDDALIPPRILLQRSVLLGCLVACFMQGGMMAQAYYLPFYFQAVKGTDSRTSGISILPYGITTSLATIASGVGMTMAGVYVPFMWLGSALYVIGGGLLYTLARASPLARWFGYQVLAGAGYGTIVQVPFFAIQVVLCAADIPVGTTLVVLSQCLGGAVGLAIAQSVFQNTLLRQLYRIESVDASRVLASGGVSLQDVVAAELLDEVRDTFNDAVVSAFLVAVGLGGGAFLASAGMERRQIGFEGKKSEKLDKGPSADMENLKT